MITEPGRVVGIEDGHVLVETEGRTGCARCEAGTGCGSVLMGRVLGDRLHVVRALDGGVDGLAPGVRVSIGLRESALVRGAALVYLVPLAGLFAGMLVGRWLGGPGDAVAALGAAAGLVLGAITARSLAGRAARSSRYHPVIVRREGRQ